MQSDLIVLSTLSGIQIILSFELFTLIFMDCRYLCYYA